MLQHELGLQVEGSSSKVVHQQYQHHSVQPPKTTKLTSGSTVRSEQRINIRLSEQIVRHPKGTSLGRRSSRIDRRRSARDSDSTLEFQLFPTEIATDENYKEIRNRLPESIRDQCTFKDRYWWYHGDPANLSGLTKGDNSEDLKSRAAVLSKAIHPVIQRGSITIAGRPLLIEDCFRRSRNSWTCIPDVNLMQDTPIPQYKDGKTVVVPFEPIKEPANTKWTGKDPLSPRVIDPQKYSEKDFYDIAKAVWPYEFCLWLDGTLQIMLSKKDFKKASIAFPKQVGGLKVTFAHGIASSIQTSQPRSSISSATSDSNSSLRSNLSSHRYKLGRRISSTLKPTRGIKDSEIKHQSSFVNVGGVPTSIGTRATHQESKINVTNDQSVSSSAPPLSDIHHSTQNGHAKGGNAGSSTVNGNIEENKPNLADDAKPSPEEVLHVPCEVIVGETIELGVACFVGVKVRDNTDNQALKITIPTSAALEAACKARKAAHKKERLIKWIQGETSIEVIGLSVWIKSNQEKIGTITHCYDPSLHTYSKHPDDFKHDICLVEAIAQNSFDAITSPCPQWWTRAHNTEPTQIIQHTRLHIVCPTKDDLSDNARAIDGKELAHFAFNLPDEPPNAVYQAVRGVPQGRPKVKSSAHYKPGSEHAFSKDVLATSTLYRFEGVINSWDQFRGAAVVHVGDKGKWESVFGLHSFEYLAGEGKVATRLGWEMVRKEMVRGTLSLWGCRHLPEELTRMELCR